MRYSRVFGTERTVLLLFGKKRHHTRLFLFLYNASWIFLGQCWGLGRIETLEFLYMMWKLRDWSKYISWRNNKQSIHYCIVLTMKRCNNGIRQTLVKNKVKWPQLHTSSLISISSSTSTVSVTVCDAQETKSCECSWQHSTTINSSQDVHDFMQPGPSIFISNAPSTKLSHSYYYLVMQSSKNQRVNIQTSYTYSCIRLVPGNTFWLF